MGFDYFYGFMGGESDQWTPYLFRDHTQIFPWIGKPGYNLTTDMADEAIKHMRSSGPRAPDQPFFVYYVPGGSHSPHQPTAGMDREVQGQVRHGLERHARRDFRQPETVGGHSAEDAELTEWPDSLAKWETLSADEKKLFARQAEVFAAYTAYTDHEIGRVIQAVEDMGKLDNTLIIYICGDNGTSPEGSLLGTPNRVHGLQRHPGRPGRRATQVLRRLGIGGDLPAHGGRLGMGVRHAVQMDQADRFALRRHAPGPGDFVAGPHQGCRRHPHPVPPYHRYRADNPRSQRASRRPEMVDGIEQKPIEGVSMTYTFHKANTASASTRTTQYFEMVANRGIYHEGWYANTTPPVPPWVLNAADPDVDDYKWELYNLTKDYSQANDLAAQMPDKLKQMQAVFAQEAEKHQVYPLRQ